MTQQTQQQAANPTSTQAPGHTPQSSPPCTPLGQGLFRQGNDVIDASGTKRAHISDLVR